MLRHNNTQCMLLQRNLWAICYHSIWTDLKRPITPEIYSTIVITWTNHWVKGCTVLSGHSHTCDWSNFCDYNTRNGSHNHLHNLNSWVTFRCDWIITACYVSYVAHVRRKQKIYRRLLNFTIFRYNFFHLKLLTKLSAFDGKSALEPHERKIYVCACHSSISTDPDWD